MATKTTTKEQAATEAKPAARKATTSRRTAAAKPAAVVASDMPAPADSRLIAPEPVAKHAGPELKKKELIARVTAAVGAKKGGVREIVETTLTALGDALSKGENLNLPPLGKAWVNRQRDVTGGEILIVKLRRGGSGAGKSDAKEPLAATED